MSDTFYLIIEIFNRAVKPEAKPNDCCPCGALHDDKEGSPPKKFKECCGQVVEKVETQKRNDLCNCGSGKKFKKCHGADSKVGIRDMESFERGTLADTISDNAMTKATVIIDVLNQKCVKNRLDKVDEETIVKHYISHYSDKIDKAFAVWLSKKTKDFVNAPDYQKLLRQTATDLIAEHAKKVVVSDNGEENVEANPV